MVSDASPPTIAPRSPSPRARAPRRGVPVATFFRGFPSSHEEFPRLRFARGGPRPGMRDDRGTPRLARR